VVASSFGESGSFQEGMLVKGNYFFPSYDSLHETKQTFLNEECVLNIYPLLPCHLRKTNRMALIAHFTPRPLRHCNKEEVTADCVKQTRPLKMSLAETRRTGICTLP
jgi:hypothetical protein